jgi:hypothetical protein
MTPREGSEVRRAVVVPANPTSRLFGILRLVDADGEHPTRDQQDNAAGQTVRESGPNGHHCQANQDKDWPASSQKELLSATSKDENLALPLDADLGHSGRNRTALHRWLR